MLKYSLNMIIIYVSKRKLILNDQLCEIIKEMLILLKKSSDTP
jgi:hypothetical protein